MTKFAKVMLAALILLVFCAFVITNLINPGAKVTKTPTAGKTVEKNALNAPPTSNGPDSVTYNSVKPDVFNLMRRKLTQAGVQVPQGNEGDLEGYGTKIHFKWDGVTNLTISIKDKPWYISHGTITGKIHDFVLACGGN